MKNFEIRFWLVSLITIMICINIFVFTQVISLMKKRIETNSVQTLIYDGSQSFIHHEYPPIEVHTNHILMNFSVQEVIKAMQIYAEREHIEIQYPAIQEGKGTLKWEGLVLNCQTGKYEPYSFIGNGDETNEFGNGSVTLDCIIIK